MGKLEGKIAIVTGAARGNGEGIAKVLAQDGATVVLTDVLDLVHQTAQSITESGYRALSFTMDVTNPTEVNDVVQKVLMQFGKIDILVNNAGICKLANLVDMPNEVRDTMFNVNIEGTFIVTKAVLPSMLKQKYGRIVNLSSVTGPLVADIGETAYAETKAAIWGFTRALAFEVAKYGITVNAICPGMIDTEMVRGMAVQTNPNDPQSALRDLARGIPMGRLGTIEEVGQLAAFLASDEAKYITGTPVLIDGGSTLPESGVFFPD